LLHYSVVTVSNCGDVCLQNSLKDGLNYGLYLPESNGHAGKFLDDARPLRDYSLSGSVALLEVGVIDIIC